MKKEITFLIALLSISVSSGQQLVKLKFTPLQESIYPASSNVPQLKFNADPEVVAVMGGLNDWDGMNNYLNIYGSKLIIQERDIASNGVIRIVLRREDGENFYGLYPTLNAEIIPYGTNDKNPLAFGVQL